MSATRVCTVCLENKSIKQFSFRKPEIRTTRCKLCVATQSAKSGARKRASQMSLMALRRKIHTTSNLLYTLKAQLKARRPPGAPAANSRNGRSSHQNGAPPNEPPRTR